MKRFINIQSLLWLALGLALAGSLRHVAHVFYTIDKNIGWGWVQAVAVDSGLLAIALGIMQRRRMGRSVWPLWLGIAMFSVISVYANLAYGLEFSAVVPGWIQSSKPYVMAATLPILVLYLAEIVGSDSNHQYTEAERARKIEERKQSRIAQLDGISTTIELAREVKAEMVADKKQALADLRRTEPDITPKEAQTRLGISKSTYYSYVAELEANGNGRNN